MNLLWHYLYISQNKCNFATEIKGGIHENS